MYELTCGGPVSRVLHRSADALHSLSLAFNVLHNLTRLDLGDNAAIALSGAVGPTQDLQALLQSFGKLELLALDGCGALSQRPCIAS